MRVWASRAGLAAALLGVVAYIASFCVPMDTGGAWYAQVFGLMLGGVAVYVGSNFRTIKRKAGLTVVPEIEPLQQRDLECFNHLTERMAMSGDKDGIEACKRLQDCLFNLHYGHLKPEE